MPPTHTESSTVRRILLAEDNPHDQLLLEEAFGLRRLPVEIEAVPDGDALAVRLEAGVERLDLILLDAHLPKRSAEEILVEYQAKGGFGVPCIVVSSVMMAAQRAQFLRLGAAAVMTKPLDMDEYTLFAQEIYSLIETR